MRGTMEDYYETSQYAYCCDKMAVTASLQGVCIWVALVILALSASQLGQIYGESSEYAQLRDCLLS